MEGTVLHKHCGNGAAAFIKLCLNHNALSASGGISFVFLDFCYKQNVFKQILYTHTGNGGNRHAYHIAAPLLRYKLIVGKLCFYSVGVGRRLIHFVYCNDYINSGRLCMIDCLNGLGHDAVVSRHDKYGDICSLSASCSHGCESLVSGSIQEGYVLSVNVNGVSADMLSNTAGLALGNVGMTDRVKKRCFTVVNVTHYAYDGRTRHKVVVLVLFLVEQFLFDCYNNFLGDLSAHFVGHQISGVVINHLVHRNDHAHHHKAFHYGSCSNLKSGGKLTYGNFIGNRYLQRLLFGQHCLLLTQTLHCRAFLVAVFGGAHIPVVLLFQFLLCGTLISFLRIGNEGLQLFIIFGKVHGTAPCIHHACGAGAFTLVCRRLLLLFARHC